MGDPAAARAADLAEAEKISNIARQDAESRKLEAERAKLLSDKRFGFAQAVAGIGGFVTALVATFALVFSIAQWTAARNQQHTDADAARLQQAFTLSSDAGQTGSEKRLIGVTLLAAFAKSGESSENRERALIALTNLLALESDPTVRGAIVDTLASANRDVVGVETLNHVLESLVSKSRILSRSAADDSDPVFPLFASRDAVEAKARKIGEAIAATIRNGGRAQDLSGIYCADCDFSNQPLDHVVFDDAVLTGAVFRQASLASASFRGAKLDGADFSGASMDDAKFSIDSGHASKIARREARRFGRGFARIAWPDFTCANLRQADFRGYTLFGVSNLRDFGGQSFTFPSFRGADIAHAKFGQIAVLVLSDKKWMAPFVWSEGSEVPIDMGKRRLYVGRFIIHPRESRTTTSGFGNFGAQALIAFANANWRDAEMMPLWLRNLLMATGSVGAPACPAVPRPSA